ncbi:MAG: ubiquitin-like domain-containing protein [Actinomycetes bacterium]
MTELPVRNAGRYRRWLLLLPEVWSGMSAGRHASGHRVPLHRRLPSLLVQAAVVLGLVVGTTAFVTHDKTVTIAVDGKNREVRSFAGTVGDVLASEGITVDLEHDLVIPTPSHALRDGESIVVRYGRPVLLTVDGERRTVWTTADTVSEALMMLGVRSDGAYLSASRSRSIGRGGIQLDVRIPHHVTFLADGKRHEVTTTAPTVRSALTEAGLRLRTQDRVSADLAELPYAEQVVGITRVDGKRVVEEKPIRFDTIKRKTDELYKGQTEVVKEGKVGIRELRYEETYLDGKLDSRRLVQKRVAVEPVTEVVRVGTKPVPQNTPAADGLNWAALAQCESSGNPDAYNGAGPYYGLYQFLESTWHSVGGTGVPTDHSANEQTYRAQILYRRSGAGQWPVCGRQLFT